jgi:hypothetical protein
MKHLIPVEFPMPAESVDKILTGILSQIKDTFNGYRILYTGIKAGRKKEK